MYLRLSIINPILLMPTTAGAKGFGGNLYGSIVDMTTPLPFIEGDEVGVSVQLVVMLSRVHSCAQFEAGNVTLPEGELECLADLQTASPNLPEPDLYFYHSNHLGSSSWITDASGAVNQHLQYLPPDSYRDGEDYIYQRNSSWAVPYTFSGKEKDAETGYSYFGARYYDSDLSVWLSVDPLAGDFAGISPYAYVANNPIILIDPDGRSWRPTTTDGNQNGYEWVPEDESYDDDGSLLAGLYHPSYFLY